MRLSDTAVGLTGGLALALAFTFTAEAGAASRERENLDLAIREAQAEIRYPGREPRVDELLGRARDRLWRHDEDPDLRQAIRRVERAIEALRDPWRAPSERARVRLGTFTKRTFEGERFTASIAGATAARGFGRVVVVVTPGERGLTPIVNTVLVRVQGRWVEHAVRHRTQVGENVLAIEVPRGATEIVFSLDHGKGAAVEAFLD